MPSAQKKIESFKSHLSKEIAPTAHPFWLDPILDHNKPVATIFAGGGYDQKMRRLLKVTIVHFDPITSEPAVTIFAKSAEYSGGNTWTADDVSITQSGIVTHAAHMDLHDIKGTPDDIQPLEANLDDYTFSELMHQIDIRKAAGDRTKPVLLAEVDLWQKLALPFATFVFALVGAPIALRPQRASSKGVAVAMGIGIIIGYYSLFKILETIASGGGMDPATAAFAPNAIGLALAAWLSFRATT
jgi:lipopolysaccharide export system permease protein